jgi:hypothetical protein
MVTKRILVVAFIVIASFSVACHSLMQKEKRIKPALVKYLLSPEQNIISIIKEKKADTIYLPAPASDVGNDGVPDSINHSPTIYGSGSNNGYSQTASENRVPVGGGVFVKRSATLGYKYDHKIRSLEDGFLRVVVKVNGSPFQVRTIIRESEREEQQVEVNKDTTTIFIISNIEVYKSLLIKPLYSPADFTLTPIGTELEQELDLVKGNQWLWKIKAESKEPHVSTVTIEVKGSTPKGFSPLAIRHIPIEIAILSPPSSYWKKLLIWIGDKIGYFASAFLTACAAYFVKRIFEKKKE